MHSTYPERTQKINVKLKNILKIISIFFTNILFNFYSKKWRLCVSGTGLCLGFTISSSSSTSFSNKGHMTFNSITPNFVLFCIFFDMTCIFFLVNTVSSPTSSRGHGSDNAQSMHPASCPREFFAGLAKAKLHLHIFYK